MDFINLTPHEVTVVAKDGSKVTFPPSENVARVEYREEVVGDYDAPVPVSDNEEPKKFELFKSYFGTINNLPEPRDGVHYIVSRMCANACPDRHDLVVPGPSIRDENGVITACYGFFV